jgi:ABC-type Na+ efflux pump permease subunit
MKYILGTIGIFLVLISFVSIIGSSTSKDKKTDTSKEVASKSTQNTDKTSLTTNEKDSKKQDTKITYENFLNIKMGQSYEEVVALLGEGKEISPSKVSSTKATVYDWKETGISDMNITIQNNVVIAKSQLGLESMDAQITMDKYNQVQNGISYYELKEILGEGQVLSQDKTNEVESIIYEYINQNESNANFTFSDGKLTGKSQFNLE